jgi:predicted RNA-binding protein with PUA-like domain
LNVFISNPYAGQPAAFFHQLAGAAFRAGALCIYHLSSRNKQTFFAPARKPAAWSLLTMYYLLKTEPSVYSFADLQKEQSTIWDGVTNPFAVKNLRNMQKGDRLVIYHTGDEKTAVGTATVESVDISDTKVPKVRIRVGQPIGKPHTLADIKANKLFTDSPLVRQGRLSVVPLNAEQFKWLVE